MQKGYIHVLTACTSMHVNVIKLGLDAFLSLQFMIIFLAAISSGIVVWCGRNSHQMLCTGTYISFGIQHLCLYEMWGPKFYYSLLPHSYRL